jgi:hypothetical protein
MRLVCELAFLHLRMSGNNKEFPGKTKSGTNFLVKSCLVKQSQAPIFSSSFKTLKSLKEQAQRVRSQELTFSAAILEHRYLVFVKSSQINRSLAPISHGAVNHVWHQFSHLQKNKSGTNFLMRIYTFRGILSLIRFMRKANCAISSLTLGIWRSL